MLNFRCRTEKIRTESKYCPIRRRYFVFQALLELHRDIANLELLDENNDGFAEERSKRGRACRKCIQEISGVWRSLHIITTCLEQLYEIPLKSETYAQEPSLWIDALASYLRRIAPGCAHIPLKSKEDAVHATFQI